MVEAIAVQREFAEERSHASRNTDHGNERSEKHGLHARRGMKRDLGKADEIFDVPAINFFTSGNDYFGSSGRDNSSGSFDSYP